MMKCPRCGLPVNDAVPKCAGCDFTVDELDKKLGAPPPRAGLLLDDARMLSEPECVALGERLAALEQELGGEIVVVTVPNTRGVKPSQLVFWLYNRWKVGGAQHTGLLVLVAKQERRVECEVGFGWEGRLSDDESGDILEREVVPHLREGRYAEGIGHGVEALAKILRQEKSGAESSPAGVSS